MICYRAEPRDYVIPSLVSSNGRNADFCAGGDMVAIDTLTGKKTSVKKVQTAKFYLSISSSYQSFN